MKIQYFIIIIALVFGCNDKEYLSGYYPDGSLEFRMEIDKDSIPNGVYEGYYPTGELMTRTIYTKGKTLDTVYSYFKNKQLKEKGMLTGKLYSGWWLMYTTSGRLKEKKEFIIIDNKSHLNQKITFDKNGDTIYEKSSFFKLYVPDTLKVGKNVGRIKYNSEFKTKDKFFYVVIDNQISESEIHHDTFPDEPNFTRFGIYAHKSGKKMVKAAIVETIIETKELSKDSAQLTVSEYKRYFSKEVFVIP